jgi:hypothetical protein
MGFEGNADHTAELLQHLNDAELALGTIHRTATMCKVTPSLRMDPILQAYAAAISGMIGGWLASMLQVCSI